MKNEQDDTIERRRNSAGSMTVGLVEEGKISRFYKIGNDQLFIIKSHAVYQIYMADSIDPDRSNGVIPNVQQRVLNAGSDSEIVQAILIQSDELLRDEFLRGIDIISARRHAVEATSEILAMSRIRDRVRSAEEEQIKSMEGKKLEQGSIIPFLDDALQDTKNFLNRSDHFMKSVQSISKIFLGRFANWDSLFERESKIGLSDEEKGVFEKVIRYAKFIREARNASEHPQDKKHITVRNFSLLPSAEIATPTFEFVHPRYGEPEVDLPVFMEVTLDSLLNLYGAWLALLCSRKASSNPYAVGVMLMPKERRKYPRAGYCYALPTKDGWQPLA